MKFTGRSIGQLDRVVTKLNSMMFRRFGVEVEYLPILGADETSATIQTVKRNSGAPMIVTYNQLIVPIRAEGMLTGAARVQKINHLSPRELMQVKETIDLVFFDLISADEYFPEASDDENVISLFDRRAEMKQATASAESSPTH